MLSNKKLNNFKIKDNWEVNQHHKLDNNKIRVIIRIIKLVKAYLMEKMMKVHNMLNNINNRR